VAQAPVGRPEKRARGAAREAEGFGPDQKKQGVECHWGPGLVKAVNKIVKISEGASLLPGTVDSSSEFRVKTADSVGSEDYSES